MLETQYLSLVAITPDDSKLLIELTRLAAHHECLITQCHINQYGESYLMNAVLSGNWSAIAKIETSLNTFQKKAKILFLQQRVSMPTKTKSAMPYTLYIISQDSPQILNQILQFLKQDNLVIQEIFSENYLARFTQIPMQSMTIRIQLSTDLAIGEWRDQFMLFCDDINVDAVMEPEKW
jgi:glycine cleavage system transcriptional repressor